MTDAPPIAPERVEAVMAAVSRSVRSAVSDPMRPQTLWQLADALLNTHPDYVDRGVRGELNRSGRERPGWQWLALVVGLYDRERVRTSKAEVVNTRLMLLGLARLDDEFDALLRRFRAHRRLGVAAAGSMLRPWARAAAATQLLPIWDLEYDIFLNCCAVDRRGRWLAAGANDGAIVLWDLATGRRQAVFPANDVVHAVAFSPDGAVLAAGGSLLRLVDMRTLAPLPTVDVHESGVHTVRFSPDGRLLAVLHWASPPVLVDLESRDGRVLEGHAGRANGCAFGPGGRILATAGADETVRLWDPATGAETAVLEAATGEVFRCAIHGPHLAAATTGGPTLWRLGPEPERLPIELPGGSAADCAFNLDGSLLAFAFPDGPLSVWDMGLGVERDSFEGGSLGCAFGGDGRLLVGWGSQGVRAWDAASGAPRAAVEAYPAQVAIGAGLLAQAGSDAAEERGVAQVWEEVAQSQLPAVAADALGDEDLIGVQADAAALADVIAASGTEPPLSIGLFGDWGSGKSFLIRRVQAQVRRLAVRSRNASGESYYCRYIRNVEFNAWQYAEGDLWASLVTHLFDELAKPEPAAGVSSAERAREQLAELEAALAERSGVRERLERARTQADQAAATQALRRWTWSLAGVEGDPPLAETVRDTRSTLGLLLPNRRAKLLAGALVLLVALVLASLLVVVGVDRLVAVVASIGAAVTAAAGVAATAVDRVRALVQRVGATVRVSEVQRAGLDAELAAARAAETALQTELTDLAAGRRVGRFATERSHSDDYRAQLGVVSRIHDDFERMSDLLAQQRQRSGGTSDESAEDESLPRIDRIVLYIDDLDRCPPRRVVEVLEAVHLILALPLFVVVLAVDPRWLLQSLRLHYSELLAAEGDGAALGGGEEQDWRSTPLHYVEKIIQVPFALRPMNRDSARSLVHGLLPLERAADGGPAPPPPPDADPAASATTEGPAPRERRDAGGPPVAAPAPSLTPRTLGLTPPERDFAADVAAALHTPRAIKKFTNLYRLLRARLDERSGELDAFLDDSGPDVPEYQAVLILIIAVISFPDDASRLLIDLLDPEGADSWPEHVRAARYGDGRELAEFLSWSTGLAAHGATSSRQPFRRWAHEVSRYSFETGQQVFARVN